MVIGDGLKTWLDVLFVKVYPRASTARILIKCQYQQTESLVSILSPVLTDTLTDNDLIGSKSRKSSLELLCMLLSLIPHTK